MSIETFKAILILLSFFLYIPIYAEVEIDDKKFVGLLPSSKVLLKTLNTRSEL